MSCNPLSMPKVYQRRPAFARASAAASTAKLHLRASSHQTSHTNSCTSHQTSSHHSRPDDSPIQAHRSYLASATVSPAPAHPTILDSARTRRRCFLHDPQCASYAQLPRQPHTRPATQVHYLDRRHRPSKVDRAVTGREGCANNAAIVQLGRYSYWRDCNCMNTASAR